jgi:hypothetical protein
LDVTCIKRSFYGICIFNVDFITLCYDINVEFNVDFMTSHEFKVDFYDVTPIIIIIMASVNSTLTL